MTSTVNLLSNKGVTQLLDLLIPGTHAELTDRSRPSKGLHFALDEPVREAAIRRAGCNRQELLMSGQFPTAFVPAFDELHGIMLNHCIYKPTPAKAHEDYYLQLYMPRRALFLKYQQIIGSRDLAILTEAQVEVIIDKLAVSMQANLQPA